VTARKSAQQAARYPSRTEETAFPP
jgi:hypothetical protein